MSALVPGTPVPAFAAIQALRRLGRRVDCATALADVAGARAGLARFLAPHRPAMLDGVARRALGRAGFTTVVEFAPATERAAPAVYLHGGGLVFHDVETFAPVLATLAAESGRRILALDYPKAPETPARDLVPGLIEAIAATAERHDAGVLAGDSIGGLLALAAALGPLRARSLPLALVYPVLSLADDLDLPSRRLYGAGYMLDADYMAHFRALAREGLPPGFDPMALSAADAAALGPVRILGAELDVLADEAPLFEDRARALGASVNRITLPGLPHDFLLFAGRVPEAADGLRRLGREFLA